MPRLEQAMFLTQLSAGSIARRSDVSEAEKKYAVKKKYGDVKYCDPVNKKYPVDTPGHRRAAKSYIGMKRNAGKYSSADLAKIKRCIYRSGGSDEAQAQASEGFKWGNRPRMFSRKRIKSAVTISAPMRPPNTAPTMRVGPMGHSSAPIARTPSGGGRVSIRGRGKKMTSLLVKYKKACAAGWKDPRGVIQAVAPPGWSEEKMVRLKRHVGKTNAFRLAWWMHKHGRGPGAKSDAS